MRYFLLLELSVLFRDFSEFKIMVEWSRVLGPRVVRGFLQFSNCVRGKPCYRCAMLAGVARGSFQKYWVKLPLESVGTQRICQLLWDWCRREIWNHTKRMSFSILKMTQKLSVSSLEQLCLYPSVRTVGH